ERRDRRADPPRLARERPVTTQQRGSVLAYSGQLVIETCCECHMAFAMPADLQRQARESAAVWFYCPAGHKQHYATSETQNLRDQLARAEQQRDYADTRARAARDQADSAERSARAYKGHLTRARKRIGNGTCPACSRHF